MRKGKKGEKIEDGAIGDFPWVVGVKGRDGTQKGWKEKG